MSITTSDWKAFIAMRAERQATLIEAARRLGSTLRGTLTVSSLANESGIPARTIAAMVQHLGRAGRWPYATVEPGVWRDTRPWFERIAREVGGYD